MARAKGKPFKKLPAGMQKSHVQSAAGQLIRLGRTVGKTGLPRKTAEAVSRQSGVPVEEIIKELQKNGFTIY